MAQEPRPCAELRIAQLEAQTELMADQLATMRVALAMLLPAILDALDARGGDHSKSTGADTFAQRDAALPTPTILEPLP
jgi:hypothetical protein